MEPSGTKVLLLFILEEWKLLIILTTLFALYFHYTSTFDFFEKKGIAYAKPTIIIGNLGPRLSARQSFHEFHLEFYNKYKGKRYAGIFEGRLPVLTILDPDIIKNVLIGDFDQFSDRYGFDTNDYLKRALISLKGADWKDVRSVVTPTFSSARLKNMLPLVQICCDQMVHYLKQHHNSDLEMKHTLGRYTLEVIGSCAFGIKCDALSKETTRFVEVAGKFADMSKVKRAFILFMLLLMPKMLKFLKISFFNMETIEELVDILKRTKLERLKSGVKKNDFLQLLLDAADKENEDNKKTTMDDETVIAQCVLFLLAGFETSSTLLSFAVHVLALKPEVQSKLRIHVLQATNGKDIDYELLSQLQYLEAFLMETLRIFPPVSRVLRVCTRDTTLRGTSIKVNVGEVVSVPIYGIHMDADYYPEPLEFRPERFMNEEKNNRPSHLFLPFGAGPRNCIGLRFAMITAKLAMVTLLKNFKFSVCDKTQDPIQFNTKSLLLSPADGLWVHIENI